MPPDQNQTEVQMPITRLSYSALTQLLRNPLIFKLKHILNVYDGKIGVSGMVGRAGHEALKIYYGGDPEQPRTDNPVEDMANAIAAGMKYLEDFSDNYISYGKTGSREQMLKTYTKAMQFYFSEEPKYHEILYCEEKMEAELHTTDGQLMPLPAVAIPDLVHRDADGKVEIIDFKFVRTFTDWEEEDFIKIVQSMFLWHVLRDAKGITADRMVFREIKTSENSKDAAGQPQVRDWVIPFDHKAYHIIFYNLYRDVVRFLANPNAIYLPNLSDPFDGAQAGLLYSQGLINADMSDVEVMHKVKDVALVSKLFVPSRLDMVENKHLPPEERIKLRLAEFGIPVEPQESQVGASVTQYRFKVSRGIRMSVFEKHKADIAMAIEAKGNMRILAPIPGTDLVGVEVQNETRSTVTLGKEHLTKNTLTLPIGVDIHGEVIKVPLDDMPHLLIAGSTGSGKSILLGSIITALQQQMPHKKMHMILIDPKRVELRKFGPTIYEYQEVAEEMEALVNEMEIRYRDLEKHGVRNITEFNALGGVKFMPYKVVVIDEFADLILRSKREEKKKKARLTKRQVPDIDMEMMIVRLAQMARAVGIHLIIATQRPSVDVITGLIKANFPSRIALTTASPTDSIVILGEPGAEKLAGKGDMLFIHPGGQKVRLQGFITK